MSSPVNRIDSPSHDEHAKRKRDEIEAQLAGGSTVQTATVSDPDADAKASKKIKPEIEPGTPVSKAEVKQIQRDLKTMPLEDGQSLASNEHRVREMEEVESDHGSNEDASQDMEESTQQSVAKVDTPDDTGSTPSSDNGDQEESGSDKNGTEAKSSKGTNDLPLSSKPTLGGLGNTSTVSPFANAKPSVFGSSSTTLKGFNAASIASPFAAVEKANIFDTKPASLASGVGNISSMSPFANAASSTNIFGEPAKSVFGGGSAKSVFGEDSVKSVFGESAKSVFGQSNTMTTTTTATSTTTTTTTTGCGPSPGHSTDATAGSVFGARSVIGSKVGASGPTPSAFATTLEPSSSSSFSTFGTTHSFGGESSFTTGSFIDHETNQDKTDFGSLLSQDTGEFEDGPEQQEGDDHTYASSQFCNVDQIDVQTGEEDEVNIYQTKGKLYADAEKSHAWKERGKGTFRINVNRKDTHLARLVMRADGVLRLILNVAIFPDMNMAITGDKYVRFVGIEDGQPISFLLKVKDALAADEVVDYVKKAIDRQGKSRTAA